MLLLWWQEHPGETVMVVNSSFTLFTQWHLRNLLQRHEPRWAAEMHHAAFQMSHWAWLCSTCCLRHSSVMNQYKNITFNHVNKTQDGIYFSLIASGREICDLGKSHCWRSLLVSSPLIWWIVSPKQTRNDDIYNFVYVCVGNWKIH